MIKKTLALIVGATAISTPIAVDDLLVADPVLFLTKPPVIQQFVRLEPRPFRAGRKAVTQRDVSGSDVFLDHCQWCPAAVRR